MFAVEEVAFGSRDEKLGRRWISDDSAQERKKTSLTWHPLVFAPEFAFSGVLEKIRVQTVYDTIDNNPGTECFSIKFSSYTTESINLNNKRGTGDTNGKFVTVYRERSSAVPFDEIATWTDRVGLLLHGCLGTYLDT